MSRDLTYIEMKNALSRLASLVISQGIITAELVKVVDDLSTQHKPSGAPDMRVSTNIASLKRDLQAFNGDVDRFLEWLEND